MFAVVVVFSIWVAVSSFGVVVLNVVVVVVDLVVIVWVDFFVNFAFETDVDFPNQLAANQAKEGRPSRHSVHFIT